MAATALCITHSARQEFRAYTGERRRDDHLSRVFSRCGRSHWWVFL